MKPILSILMLFVSISSFSQKVTSEFIYEQAPFPSCHASTIAETPNGLICAWFGGTEEKNPDVGIWVSRKVGDKWSPPIEVANGLQTTGKRYPTWNPVLFQLPGKELILFYKVGPNPREWWGALKRSFDEGKTWTKEERLPDQIYGPIKNKPELLADGTLICPSSTEDQGWRVHFEMTKDGGKTWTRTEAINDGKEFSAIQPSLLFLPDNKLQILCRSMNGTVLRAESNDQGKSWSSLEPTDLPNPNSGTDAVTLKNS